MIEHLIGSRTRIKLLQVFFRNPERAFFVRELSRLLETQINAVRRELANLEKIGLITQVEAGHSEMEEVGTERSKYYKISKDFLLFAELKALLLKSQMLEEQEFVEAIKKRAGTVHFLLLTGIFTNDTDAPTDILIAGDVKAVQMAKLIREFEKMLGKPIRYTVMSDKEFAERREMGDRFMYSVFEAKNIITVDEYHLYS